MKRLSNKSPCKDCTKDSQIGNPYNWQTPCYNCQEKREWISEQLARLDAIENVLGEDYDLERIAELVQADNDKRFILHPLKAYDKVYILVLGSVLQFDVTSAVWYSGDPYYKAVHGLSLSFVFRQDAIGKTVFLTREAAEAALKGEQP